MMLLIPPELADWTTFLGDLFRFEPATNLWAEMPPAFEGGSTVARNSMGIASIGELLYIFGGYNTVDNYGFFQYYSEAHLLPRQTNLRSKLRCCVQFPVRREGCARIHEHRRIPGWTYIAFNRLKQELSITLHWDTAHSGTAQTSSKHLNFTFRNTESNVHF
jgi:hypothetical protein